MKTIIITLSLLSSIYTYSQSSKLSHKPSISPCEFADNYFIDTSINIDSLSNNNIQNASSLNDNPNKIMPTINYPKKMIHYKLLDNLSLDGATKLVYAIK